MKFNLDHKLSSIVDFIELNSIHNCGYNFSISHLFFLHTMRLSGRCCILSVYTLMFSYFSVSDIFMDPNLFILGTNRTNN